jgi:hypothetical protein
MPRGPNNIVIIFGTVDIMWVELTVFLWVWGCNVGGGWAASRLSKLLALRWTILLLCNPLVQFQ